MGNGGYPKIDLRLGQNPFFTYKANATLHQKSIALPQPFNQFRVCQESNEQGSLVWTDTVLITPCFPEAWVGVTVLTVTDSLSLRFEN